MTANDAYDSDSEVGSGDSFHPGAPYHHTGEVSAEGVHATVFSDVGGAVRRAVRGHVLRRTVGGQYPAGRFPGRHAALDSNGANARVRIIGFPRHLAADRFDIKDMSRLFRDRN
jgi:hypothetical protein